MKDKLKGVEKDIKTLLPVIKAIKIKRARQHIGSGYVDSTLREAGITASSYKEAMTFFESYLTNITHNTGKLFTAIDDGTIAVTNSRTMEVLENVVTTYTSVYMGISDIIMSIFDEEKPSPVKQAELIRESRFVGSIYESIHNEDVVKEVVDVPTDIPTSALQGFLKKDSFIYLSNFNGNPFFIIGKLLNRRDKKRRDLLKSRLEYVKLELLELEMEEDSSKDHKKHVAYYKDLIHELEMEIDDIH